MNTHNLTYRGLDMSSSLSESNGFVIKDIDKNVALRTAIFDNNSYHGSKTSYTLAEGRLFTVSGQVFGASQSERMTGQTALNDVLKPEYFPGQNHTGFYELTWTDDGGVQMKAQAKVYKMPQYSDPGGCSPYIDFTFELYIEESSYKGYIDKNASGGYGLLGGVNLGTKLGIAFDSIVGEFIVNNAGNFIAPCKVTVTGSVDNPRIYNITNSRYYGLSGYTSDLLIIDNTGKNFIVTDNGTNVKSYRSSGSQLLMLNPGDNTIVLTGDNYSVTSTVTIEVEYNDSYISN